MFYPIKKQPQSKVNVLYIKLLTKYESIKKHNNQTDKERKDWYWYENGYDFRDKDTTMIINTLTWFIVRLVS